MTRAGSTQAFGPHANISRLRHSAATLALMAAACAGPAQARDAGADAASTDDASAIVVTARLRAEDEQQVPAAMTVIGGDTLDRTRTFNLNLLTQLAPTLNYSSPNPRNTAYTIRGLGSSVVAISQANDGLEPGVGFYVDGVYHARPATAAFDFADIDQVEVLRGPQGTVFGKNTTAGAIVMITRAPSFTYGAQGEVSFGQQGFKQAKAVVTGPILPDLLAFRLSGALTRRDGTIFNTRLDRWQNDVHTDTLRGELLLTPSPDFSLRLIGDWSDFKAECCTQVFVRVAPTLKPLAQQYAALAAGQSYAPPSTDPYARLTNIDAGIGTDTSEGGASATAELKLAHATITQISAWRFWNWDAANDRDYTGLPIQLIQHIPSRQDQFSEELRVASHDTTRFDYVAGLYYFQQRISGHPISTYGPLAAYWLLPAGRPANLLDGYTSSGNTRFSTYSYGIYGEATWHLLPRLALTGGIRYTREDKDGTYAVTTSGGLATTNAALIADQNSIARAQSYSARLSDGSASGRVNLAYQFDDQVMGYLAFARGQKSGGINMSGLPVYPAGVSGHASGDPILATATVRPEHNTTWEVGLKTQAFDHALTFNVDAFAVTVRDFQANVVDNAAVIALRSYLANVPKVTVKGVEFDGTLRLGGHVSLRASGAFSDGKYADYPSGPCPIELTGSATTSCDLTGKPMPGLPRWSGSVGGEYRAPVTLARLRGNVVLGADLFARSRIYGDATDSAYTVIPGYAVANASLGFQTPHWDISLFVRNLFDRDYLQNVTVQAGNSGLIVGTPSDPRMIGVTLKIRS